MNPNLVGGYDLSKSNLTAPNLHLVIGTRHKPEATKPKHYLLLRLPDRSHRYISSLYPATSRQDAPTSPQDAQIFTFDYKGVEYTLTLKPAQNRAEIEPCKEGGSAKSLVYQ